MVKNRKKFLLVILVLVSLAALLLTGCTRSEVTSLVLSPAQIASGGTTFVIVKVQNSGSRSDNFAVVLKVNGVEVDRQVVPLGAGTNQTVTFALVEEKTGTYEVTVGNLKANLTVVANLPSPPPSPVTDQNVPLEFRPIYNNLSSALDLYNTYLNSQTGPKYPVIFGAELLPANSNRGPELLQPQVIGAVRLYLDRLQELGVQGVTIPIHFPVYTPNFPRYSEYVAFFKQVVQEVRKRNLKLDIESHVLFANTVFSPVQFNFSNLTFDQYKAARRQMIESIINDLHPDFLNIGAEPDTETKLSGYSELADPAKYADYVNYLVHGLNKRGVKIVAGIGTWGNLSYVRNFVTNNDLDGISIHIYPVVGDTLQKTVQIINLAGQYHKQIVLDEAWLYKTDSLTAGDIATAAEFFQRDAFNFWAPLDQKFLSTIVNLARSTNIAYISPFWTNFFFAYLDYDLNTANLSYREIVNLVNQAASRNISGDNYSATGLDYRQLIQSNK